MAEEFPRPTRREAAFAGLAGAAGVAGSFAVTGYAEEFVVAPIDALVVRATPGPVIAFAIQTLGDAGHVLHIALSFGIAWGLLGAAGLAGILATRRMARPFGGIGLAGILAWVIATAVTGRPVLAVAAGAPVAALAAAGTVRTATPDRDPSRRRVLGSAAGALGFVGLAAGLGLRLGQADEEPGDGAEEGGPTASMIREAEARELDIAGGDVPGLVSPIDEFYNVDIAEFDPDLSAEGWSMTITGEVGEDVTVTFEELTEMPVERRHVTLRCVGEPLNGPKLDNAVWTGTPIAPLLEEADPDGACDCAMLRAEDDYSVQFPVEALADGLLAWRMNGRPLPQSHGHPVRVLVPGHWGETNVKWLSEIELLEEEADGYWEKKGWQGTGPVNTVAKLWDDTRLEDGRYEVAGHAYAGTRGIERVEVSVDGGDTWADAELSETLPGEDVWRQWRYVFEPDGTHRVVVRATDGEGTLQPREESNAYPSGATGWVTRTFET